MSKKQTALIVLVAVLATALAVSFYRDYQEKTMPKPDSGFTGGITIDDGKGGGFSGKIRIDENGGQIKIERR